MNRIRKLATDLSAKYPNLFSSDFEKNKRALAQISVIRSTSVRNQLAGAITTLMREKEPPSTASVNVDEEQEPEKETAATESMSQTNAELAQPVQQ